MQTIRTIVARETGYVCDPHTAVGIAATRRVARRAEPMVTLATAHPAKFPDAVAAATGSAPCLYRSAWSSASERKNALRRHRQ